MPGAYTHTDITHGATLTHTVYNADHENHITNREPLIIDDFSASVVEMQSTQDPGETSGETLADSLAQELMELRYALQEMRNTAQWYFTGVTRIEQVPCYANTSTGVGWTTTGTNHVRGYWRVPEAWTTGNLTFKLLRRVASGTGTAVMDVAIARLRDGSAFSLLSNTTATYSHLSPGFGNTTHEATFTIASSNVQAGDVLLFNVIRFGDSGSDDAPFVLFDGASISYASLAGRP